MKKFEQYISEAEDWDDKWKKMAQGTFPILLWCAINNEKITYSELNKYLLLKKFSTKDYKGSSKRFMGHPAGLIGGYMLELGLPIINSLLVQKNSGIPGEGADHFIGEFLNKDELSKYDKLTPKAKREFLNTYVWSRIYSYDWSDLLAANNINLKKFNLNDFSLKSFKKNQINKFLKSKFKKAKITTEENQATESDEHKELKKQVLSSINRIHILKKMNYKKKDGKIEYLLPSLDSIDVLFKNNNGIVGVEVKSILSDDADLRRGIYQCVKYKHLLEAELLEVGMFPFAQCILVLQRKLPKNLTILAKMFNMTWVKL